MKYKQALDIFGIRDGKITKPELKSIYRKLSLRYHPDKEGGSEKKFKLLGEAYEMLQSQYSFGKGKQQTNAENEYQSDPNYWYCFGEEMEKAYMSIMGLNGLNIEVIGSWLWVTGNTYEHKAKLKENGFYFSRKKMAWYWREEWKKNYYRRGNYSLDEIRGKYGSTILNNEETKKLQGAMK